MSEILIGLALGLSIAGLLVALLAYQRARDAERNQGESFPYWVRNGLEDAMVPNVRSRMLLEQIKAWLESFEREMRVQDEIIGEIRNGEYDKDQQAKER